jgi:type IV pilus assembly protein PilC
MLGAGLTLLRALSILEEQTSAPKLREAVGQVGRDVQSGMQLSTAMAKHDTQFPALMVNMIRAGETGGFLDDALRRIAKMQESDANLKAKIKSAMTYPVIVLIFAALLGAGVLVFIVPVFEKMFKQLGGALPLPTQIMVNMSHSMWWLGPLVIALAVFGLRAYRTRYRKNYAFRLKCDQLKLRLPVFGKLLTKVAISRWSRNLGTLLHVGVPMMQALDIVGGTAGNAVIGEAMEEVKAAVRVGAPISVPLHKHPIFPSMVVQMVEVGEETGEMTQMLDKVADFYEKEVETTTESLTSAMEPLLVVLMGAVIGTMVVCLYLPMFSIYQNIQN